MGHTIFLIHAFPLDGAMWSGQTAFLRAAGHTVFTPDLPGFAATPAWPHDRYSIEALADDIHRQITAHGGRAIVGGCSMGGYILLALLRAHPQAVQAAIFFDTRAEADTPEARANRLKSIDQIRAAGTEPLAQTMLPRLLSPHAPQNLRDEVLATMRRQSPAGVCGAQNAMAQRRDQTDLLPTISCPKLLIFGQEDIITPPATGRAMHSQMPPPADFIEIPQAGHLANMERPAAVNQAIETFLSQIP